MKRRIDIQLSPEERARKAIADFARLIGYPALAGIPIRTFSSRTHVDAPAYTTEHGIFIRDDTIPEEVPVFLAHELGHHVWGNPEDTAHFLPLVVSYAEDYVINYHINKWWKYDVRKVTPRLIYNARWGKMPVKAVCEEIVEKHKGRLPNGCWCRGISHPLLLQAAHHIRRKYNVNHTPQPLLITDKVDDAVFMDNLPIVRKALMSPALSIDLYELTKAFWLKSYTEPLTPSGLKPGPLSLSQTLLHNWTFQTRQENSEFANLAATVYISTIARAQHILANRMREKRGYEIRYKARWREMDQLINDRWQRGKNPKRQWVKDRERYAQTLRILRKKLAYLERLYDMRPNYLGELHRLEPAVLSGAKPPSAPTLRILSRFRKKEAPFRMTPTVLVHEVKWLSRYANHRLDTLIDIEDMFKNALSSLLSKEEKERPSEDDNSETPTTDEDTQPRPDPDSLDTENEPGEGEEETEDDGNTSEEGDEDGVEREGEEESEDNENEEKEEKPGKPDKKETPNERKRSDDPLDNLPPASMGGGGKGRGGNAAAGRVENLLSLADSDLKSLSRIMSYMAEFESELTTKTSKDVDENSLSSSTIPFFGNDLNRTDASEMALLRSPVTKLLFLAKLADHGLSIQAPIVSKRNAVVIAIDCSGSMRPGRYELSCGFGLAMMKKLHAEGRGCALIIFHDGIVYEVVIREEGGQFNIAETMVALITAASGGTEFDWPLLTAYRIKRDEQWKMMTTIMITDGQGKVSEYAAAVIRSHKTPDDNLTLGLIGGASTAGFQDLEDDSFKLTKVDMAVKLTRLGNEIL